MEQFHLALSRTPGKAGSMATGRRGKVLRPHLSLRNIQGELDPSPAPCTTPRLHRSARPSSRRRFSLSEIAGLGPVRPLFANWGFLPEAIADLDNVLDEVHTESNQYRISGTTQVLVP